MAKRSGLGKGLDALIPSNEPSRSAAGAMLAPIDKVIPNPRQPRQIMKDEDLEDLAASIREHGVIQPLIVTYDPTDDQYILIAGERRLRAAALAGAETVPVLVRQATDQQMLELALIENVQRADLTPLETAAAYQHLSDDFGMTHEDIAMRVGKSRVAVTNTLRLLNLPETVRKALAEGLISEGHARALQGLPHHQAQTAALKIVLEQDLTVRQTEKLVQKMSGTRAPAHLPTAPSPEVSDLETRLRSFFGTRIQVQHGKKGGAITFYYYSDEELNALIERLMKE